MPDSVEKFGGTSVANPETLLGVLETEVPDEAVLVLSAIGKITPDSTKMTDALIAYGEDRATLSEALEPLDEIAHAYLSHQKAGKLMVDASHDIEGQEGSRLWSRGEKWTSEFYSQLTGYPVVDATRLIAFRGLLRGHQIDEKATNRHVRDQLGKVGGRVIVPGYYGRGRWLRNVRTFDRGGSDVTGGVLSGILALPYTNWTDQDGVLSADPRIVHEPRLLDNITIEESRELGNGGSGVLDRNTAMFLEKYGVATTLRNTFNTEALGTRISIERESVEDENSIIAISARDDIAMINVHATGMNERTGYVERLLSHFAKAGIAVELMPTTADRVSVGYHEPGTDDNDQKVTAETLAQRIKTDRKLKPGSVDVSRHGVVYLVGQGLRDNSNRSYAIHAASGSLNDAGIPVQDIVTTPASAAIGLLVDRDRAKIKDAQRQLYQDLAAA